MFTILLTQPDGRVDCLTGEHTLDTWIALYADHVADNGITWIPRCELYAGDQLISVIPAA